MDDFVDNEEKIYYSQNNWIELDDYFVYVDKDKKDDKITIGERQSKKCRITGSMVNKCINNYGDKFLIARQIAGIYTEKITQEGLNRINHGILHEKDARNWYICATGYNIKQSIFGVYKKDYRLGAEHDGFVYDQSNNELDGIIEIKCPLNMYSSIKNYCNNSDIENFNDDVSHIPESHYDQIQMEMEIFNKNWCDYIVYALLDNKVYMKRIFRNRKHWNIMYEKIIIFLNAKLNVLLKEIESPYPYNPYIN